MDNMDAIDLIGIDGDVEESAAALRWSDRAFQKRDTEYQHREDYMNGDHDMAYATERYRITFGDLFDTFACNYMPRCVDSIADRLQIAGFDTDDPTDQIAKDAKGIWSRNHMDVHTGQLWRSALSMAEGYIIVDQDHETDEVYMWVKGPRDVRVRYSQDRPGVLLYASHRWTGDDGRQRQTLYFPDRIERYIDKSGRSAATHKAIGFQAFQRWTPDTTGDDDWITDLPETEYGQLVPVFHFANDPDDSGYGRSMIDPVIPLQDALNKTIMDTLVAMEYAAYPQRVLLNIAAQDAEPDPDDPTGMSAIDKFAVGITKMLSLQGTDGGPSTGIAEFSAADMKQYTDIVDGFEARIAKVARVPLHHLTMTGDFPSGESQRQAEGPTIALTEDRQRAWGAKMAQAVEYAISRSNLPGNTRVLPGILRTRWLSAAPLARMEQADLLIKLVSAGMGWRAAMSEVGYDPEHIDKVIDQMEQGVDDGLSALSAGRFPALLDAYRGGSGAGAATS